MKFLLLSFLLSFQVFSATTFKAKSAISVAGGYVTSLNKFDGSFELGTSNFTVSTGTLTQEANATMEGNYVGSWEVSAAGTFDSVAFTVSATNTYEMKFIASSTDAANTYVCAVVNTVENACKLFANNSNQQLVSWVGQLNTGDSVKFRIKYTGTSATIKADNFKSEPWTPQTAALLEKQNYTIQQASNAMTARTAFVEFNLATATIQNTGSSLILASSVGGDTRFIAQKQTNITVTARGSIADLGYGILLKRYNSSGTLLMTYTGANISNVTYFETNTAEMFLNASDYFIIDLGASNFSNDASLVTVSINASSVTDNVIQTWQDGRGSYKSLTYTEVNALSGNQGLGTFTAGSVEWMIGADGLLYVKGKLTLGTVSASEVRIPFPAGFITADATKIPSLQVAGVAITSNAETYNKYILVEPNLPYFFTGSQGTALSGLTKSIGNTSFQNGTQLTFTFTVPVQGVSSTPALLALPVSKTNDYSCVISFPTDTAPTTLCNSDIISSVTHSSGNENVVLNFKSGIFTAAPIVTHTWDNFGGNGLFTVNGSISSTSATIKMRNAGAAYTSSAAGTTIHVNISKQSSDYTPQGVVPVNITPDTFVQTSGAMNPVHFSVSYGTTNSSTVCTASPCTYVDQIGNYVTSITRSGTGIYSLETSKTWSKLKCTGSTSTATIFTAISSISCSNCSSAAFVTGYNNGTLDTYGTLSCDAIP